MTGDVFYRGTMWAFNDARRPPTGKQDVALEFLIARLAHRRARGSHLGEFPGGWIGMRGSAWAGTMRGRRAAIRITAPIHAVRTVLAPALERLLPDYPDIKVESAVEFGLTDIVAERFDAGIRIGELVAQDMVAVRVGPDMRSAVVAAPCYVARRGKPKAPQDLTRHTCINLRLPTRGGPYAWEFEKGGRELRGRSRGSSRSLDPPSCSMGSGRLRTGLSPRGHRCQGIYWKPAYALPSCVPVSSRFALGPLAPTSAIRRCFPQSRKRTLQVRKLWLRYAGHSIPLARRG